MRVRAGMVALALILFLLGGRQAAGQDWSASARAEASADRLAIMTLDTLAGQLAVLQVNRAALLTRYVPDAEAVSLLDRQRQALCEALDGLPQGSARAHEYAAARMVDAIVGKLAGLSVDRALRSVDRDPAHSDMKDLEAVIAALARRRDELIALHSGRVCPAGAPQRR